jgi:glutathione S-transferase
MRDLFSRRLALVAPQLNGRDYLLGNTFSVADAYLFTVLGWTDFLKIDLSPWPAFAAYRARIGARPAVVAAMKAEGLVK